MCGNRSNDVPSDVNFSGLDSGNIDLEESMDSTNDIPTDHDMMLDSVITDQYELQERIRQLEEEVSSLKHQLEEVQSCNDQLTHATIEHQGVQHLKDEIDRLRDELKKKDQSIGSLETKVSELQAEVAKLKQKLVESESDQDQVYLCQVAIEFEEAICTHVLPQVFSNNSSAKIDDLLKILNGGDKDALDPKKYNVEAVLTKARQSWDEVCENLNLPPAWKKRTGEKKVKSFHQSAPDIFRAIDLLRHKRNFVAHPNPVSVQVAEEKVARASIRKDMNEWQFKLVEDFILSMRTHIKRSGIKTDQNRLKLD